MTALEIVNSFYPSVKSVVDADKSVTLQVTKADTQTKAVKNHKECALAVAAKRALKADAAVICVKSTYIVRGDKAYRYHNPESIAREITSFDRNAGFEPGEYTLVTPPPSARLGTIRSKAGRPPYKKKQSYHRTENIRILA